MKVYALASMTSGPHEHGGSSPVERICRMGARDGGPYPPVFESQEQAEDYLKQPPYDICGQRPTHIVEIDFIPKISGEENKLFKTISFSNGTVQPLIINNYPQTNGPAF